MYAYDDIDRIFLNERVSEFRDQVQRRLAGELSEDEFKSLRLMNGVYLQLHAYMFRVAIPYGTLSSKQLRRMAHVARKYDRGYGHFTTRQNIQYNWIKLAELPDAMEDLAEVGIHAIQTSGNCVRNITTDQWAGVAPGEIEDPRVWAEVLRQLHDAASGILVPAAQVQDRDHRVRTTIALRSRSMTSACASSRTTRAKPVSKCWSVADSAAPRSSARVSSRSYMPETSSAMSRRFCVSTISTAAATTSTRRGSRSWSTNWVSRPLPGRSRPSGRRSATARCLIDDAMVEDSRGRASAIRRTRKLSDAPDELKKAHRPAFHGLAARTRSLRTRSRATRS